jgi:hypothetical protein
MKRGCTFQIPLEKRREKVLFGAKMLPVIEDSREGGVLIMAGYSFSPQIQEITIFHVFIKV